MDEGFAGAGKPGEQGLDGAAMIARSGIDDGVGGARFFPQQRCVVEGADHRLDAMGRDRIGLGPVAHQAANPMARTDQRHRRRAADIAVRTGEED